MKTGTKKVRVTVNLRPVTNLSTRVILSKGTYATMTLSESDIFKCICGKAIVEEVLPDGTFVKLDLFNYNKYNNKVNDSDENKSGQIEPPLRDLAPEEMKMGSGSLEDEKPEPQHELVNPNVAPVSQKELVNPSVSIAGNTDMDTNDLEPSEGEIEDADAEHGQADEEVVVQPTTGQRNAPQNASPKGYNANGAKNGKKH